MAYGEGIVGVCGRGGGWGVGDLGLRREGGKGEGKGVLAGELDEEVWNEGGAMETSND